MIFRFGKRSKNMAAIETEMSFSNSLLPQGDVVPPPPTMQIKIVASSMVLAVIASAALVASNAAPQFGGASSLFAGLVAAALVALILFPSLVSSFMKADRAAECWRQGNVVEARAVAQRARDFSSIAIGLSVFMAVLVAIGFFLTVSDGAIRDTFLRGELIRTSMVETAKAFAINISLAIGAEILALILGLLFALGRLLPGKGMGPVRLLAIGYIDLFRGLPAVVVIYLICFGLPLAEIPVISEANPVVYAVIALAMTHAAYNAEIFRAGIESVHPSQYSTALSLGLTPRSALIHVILPQGIGRVVPPLLGGFVALQKDTALVNIVGIIDAFAQAKIYAANHYNLSAVTTVCIFFILITIPQTRFVDYLLARRARSAKVGSA